MSTQFGRMTGGTNTAVAAAGNSQATGTALTNGVNIVATSTATSADCVVLPGDRSLGELLWVVNKTANALNVYPSTGGAINGGSANAAKALAANMGGLYISLGSGNWGAVLSA